MQFWRQYRPIDQVSDPISGNVERRIRRYDYKPLVLRKPALLSFLAVTLAFIGLLQYAVSRLPQKDRFDFPWRDQTVAQPQRSAVLRRQETTPFPDIVTIATATTTTVASSVGTPTAKDGPTNTFGVAPKSNYVVPDKTVTIDDGFAGIPQATTSATWSQDVEGQTTTDTSPKDTYGAHTADRSNYIETEKTVAVTTLIEATSKTAYVNEGPETVTPKFATLQDDPEVTIIFTSAATVVEMPAVTTLASTLPGESSARTFIVGTSVETTVYTFFEVTSTISSTMPTDQSVRPLGHGHQPGKPNDVGIITYRWTAADVFISRYPGVLLAVVYRMMRTMISNAFILIEPFRQLAAGSSGVLAERAFFRFYYKRSTFSDPLRALSIGRFALFLIATSCFLACLLPALASEALWVDTQWECPSPDTTAANPCPARMTVSVTIVRILQGFLAYFALIIIATTWALHTSRSGLSNDPSSIASVKALIHPHDLANDLAAVPAGMTARAPQKRFRGKRYALGNWENSDSLSEYGIIPIQNNRDQDTAPLTEVQHQEDLMPELQHGRRISRTHSRGFKSQDLALILIVATTFGIVLAYYLDANDDAFNRFFSSNTFGPRFILTGAGTAISIMWKGVEQQAMITGPFHRLRQGPYDSAAMHFAPTTTPLLSTWRALKNFYWALALFTVMTLLSEALNVVISGVPFASGQTWLQFLVPSYMSIGILGSMMLGTMFLLVYRRMTPALLVEPDTLGTKMYLIAKLGSAIKE